MEKQKQIFETLNTASDQMMHVWKTNFDNFEVTGVTKERFMDSRGYLGDVRCNLRNFSILALVPPDARNLPPEQLEKCNEEAWQNNQRDPNYHQRLRTFLPNGRIPTSMDMTRLGVALLCETNLLRLTDVPITLERALEPSADPVEVARQLVDAPPPAGHSKEWSKRLQALLDYRPEDSLRSDPKFAVLVAAIKNFLENFETRE